MLTFWVFLHLFLLADKKTLNNQLNKQALINKKKNYFLAEEQTTDVLK